MSISCIVRTKNSEHSIEKCLSSLINQTANVSEIIVVDSGSLDNTLQIATEFEKVKIVKYPNEQFNFSKALNLGIENSKNSYVLNFSSHCEFLEKDSLQEMLSCLTQHSKCCAVSIHPYRKKNTLKAQQLKVRYDKHNFKWLAMSNSCALIRKEDWNKYHFNEQIPSCEDQEWANYFFQKHNMHSRFLLDHYIKYDNIHYNLKKEIRDTISIINYIWTSKIERKKFIKNELKSIFKNFFRLRWKLSFKSLLICLYYFNLLK